MYDTINCHKEFEPNVSNGRHVVSITISLLKVIALTKRDCSRQVRVYCICRKIVLFLHILMFHCLQMKWVSSLLPKKKSWTKVLDYTLRFWLNLIGIIVALNCLTFDSKRLRQYVIWSRSYKKILYSWSDICWLCCRSGPDWIFCWRLDNCCGTAIIKARPRFTFSELSSNK